VRLHWTPKLIKSPKGVSSANANVIPPAAGIE